MSKQLNLVLEGMMAANLPFFCESNLQIRAKSGRTVPFKMNTVQKKLHRILETRLKERGNLRVIILKGRQMGISTYIAARYYHRVTYSKGFKCLVMAHEQKASKNLFGMVRTFYDNDKRLVTANTDSSVELVFENGGGYMVATAGSRETGRGQTIQLVHGSEAAFWENADGHVAGALQALSREDGTEAILESTANGVGYYYETWNEALTGKGDFLPVFLPWYWHEEYQDVIRDKEFTLSEEEQEYRRLYGLSLEQMAWARAKRSELGEWRFKQEYPATAIEAFQTSGENSIFKIEAVVAARRRKIEHNYASVTVAGLDIGRDKDRTVIMVRRGREIVDYEILEQGEDLMASVGLAVRMIRKHGLKFLFIDAVGMGIGVADRLAEMGYGSTVIKVNGGETKSLEEPDKYANKRAEMYGRVKEWLPDASIPDLDGLQFDFARVRGSYDSNGRLKLETKTKPSPDLSDALALTHAFYFSDDINGSGSPASANNMSFEIPAFVDTGYNQRNYAAPY